MARTPVQTESPAAVAELPAQTPPTPELRTVEAWQEKKKAPAHALAAARVLQGWAEGRQVTEADFEKALDNALNLRVGGSPLSQKKE